MSRVLCLLTLLSFMFSCSSDNDKNPEPEEKPEENQETEKYLKEGHIITGFSENTVYAGYFDEIPSGDIDLVSSSTAFPFFRVVGLKEGFMYVRPSSGTATPKLAKYAIDAETKKFVKLDEFILKANPGSVIFTDDNTGIVSTYGDRNLQIFDPNTMAIKGEIDLSQGAFNSKNEKNHITSLIHNKITDKIYAIFFTDDIKTAQYYDADSSYVDVINAKTLKWEKTIAHSNAEYPVFRGETNPIIDESGNTYIIAQGTYGLDQQFGPKSPKGSRPQILKINTNSEFEESYAFNPIDSIGFKNNYFQLFTSMVYAGKNKVYGVGTAATDDPEILKLLQKFSKEGLSDEEYGKLVSLVLYGESMKILEVDLVSKNVTEVSGTPLTAGFGYPFLYNWDGKIYTQITAGGKFGFYEIDSNASTGKEVFNLSTGGFAYQLIDLSQSF